MRCVQIGAERVRRPCPGCAPASADRAATRRPRGDRAAGAGAASRGAGPRSRRSSDRGQPSATRRASAAAVDVVADAGIGGVLQLAERDQELDVHDAARIEAQVARPGGHAPALGLDARAHAAQVGDEARLVERAVEGDRRQLAPRAAPAARRPRCCRRRARAAAPPAPSPPPRRGGSARTRSTTSPAAPARPTGAGACRPCRGAPPPASPPRAEMNRCDARANHSRWSTPVDALAVARRRGTPGRGPSRSASRARPGCRAPARSARRAATP